MRTGPGLILPLFLGAACAGSNLAEPRTPAAGERTAAHALEAPSPEVVEAYAATLPACTLSPTDTSAASESRLRTAPVVIRLPRDYRPIPELSNLPEMRGWVGPDGTRLTVSASEGGQFVIASEAGRYLDQGSCSLFAADRRSAVELFAFVRGRDTLYAATVDVPLRQHLWIGAGIVSPTLRGRSQGLAVIATLHREKR